MTPNQESAVQHGQLERPTDLTVFFDPLSNAAHDHPYELYRTLRDRAPVYYNPRRDLWVLSRYEDVRACLRNHDQLDNSMGDDVDATHDTYGPGQLIALDPPHHARVREVLGPCFAPGVISAMEQRIQRMSRDLLTRMREHAGGDFALDFALPLVFDVSMRLLGIPSAESAYFQDHLVRSMARTIGEFGIPDDAAASNREVEEHLGEILSRRRDQTGETDRDNAEVITQILLGGRNGVLDESEQVGLAHLVLSASTDVSAALLTTCMAVLDRFPELQTYLHRHPSMVEAFVEETLRYESPAQNLARQTTTEITIGGVRIPKNSRVLALIGSANRDERVYANADEFDLFRPFTADNKSLAFGEGIHACIGAQLAQLTAKVAVQELVASLEDTQARVVGTPERWNKQMVRGFAKLPVKFMSSRPLPPIRRRHISSLHLQTVNHKTTSHTLVTSEFEADVRVQSKAVVADGVVVLTLREVDDHPLPRWDPGAHVDLILDNGTTRQYSLCGDPTDRYTWRLGILHDPNGRGGSQYVHDRLQVGDTVRVRGPRNNFPLLDSSRYLFIAGGIGVTPILPMIAQAEAAGADWRLVYGGRRRASMAFLDELAQYSDRVSIRPQDETGLLELDSLLGAPHSETLVYCCGPEPLLAAVEERCQAWPARSLRVERFTPKALTEPALTEAFEVFLKQSDITLTVPPDRSILSVVEEAGVGVLSSCAEGTCGTCETAVLEGEPDHHDSVLTEDERRANDCMMICVSRSCSPRLVLDL
jgi:cytochrome P450/ferredoxin-NADP reductase